MTFPYITVTLIVATYLPQFLLCVMPSSKQMA